MHTKIFYTFFYVISITLSLKAQLAPSKFNYQVSLRDKNGQPLANKQTYFKISLVESSVNGAVRYSEIHEKKTSNAYGVSSIVIGEGMSKSGSFASLNLLSNNYFIKVEAGSSLTNMELISESQLISVPYALAANEASKLSNSFKLNLSQIENGNASTGQVLKWNGNQWLPSTDNTGSGVPPNLAGDVIGLASSNTVTRLYNRPLSATSPLVGQIIKWDGTQWGPGADNISSGTSNLWISSGSDIINNILGRVLIRNGLNLLNSSTVLGNLTVSPRSNGAFAIIDSRSIYQSFLGSTPSDLPILGIGKISQNQLGAGFTVDNTGKYSVFADIKSFVSQHPNFQDKVIIYSSIEGPEAAAYERGTAKLINGTAEIIFSKEFQLLINSNTITINVTPISKDSKGLTIFEKTRTGFIVGECLNGVGNYYFDWEVKAVRKGFEDYKVIRNKSEFNIDQLNTQVKE